MTKECYSNWKWPNIDGLQKFKGILTHSAAWPDDLDLDGKRVAVVGNGSSGIQIVANIQKRVSKLYTWVRTPIWMTAGFAQKYAGEKGANFECNGTPLAIPRWPSGLLPGQIPMNKRNYSGVIRSTISSTGKLLKSRWSAVSMRSTRTRLIPWQP